MRNQVVENQPVGIMMTSLDSVIKYAEMIKNSGFVPKNMQGKAGDIVCAITMGASIGLNMFESLHNLAVINGRVTMWGDTLKAKVLLHPDCIDIIEELQNEGTDNIQWICTAKRKGKTDTVRKFSLQDAKKAGLLRDGLHPSSPWLKYTSRMLMFKARSWALRDAFPDALRGVITSEEAQDYAPIVKDGDQYITSSDVEESITYKKPTLPESKFLNILKAINSGDIQKYDDNRQKLDEKYIIPDDKQNIINKQYLAAIEKNQEVDLLGAENAFNT